MNRWGNREDDMRDIPGKRCAKGSLGCGPNEGWCGAGRPPFEVECTGERSALGQRGAQGWSCRGRGGNKNAVAICAKASLGFELSEQSSQDSYTYTDSDVMYPATYAAMYPESAWAWCPKYQHVISGGCTAESGVFGFYQKYFKASWDKKSGKTGAKGWYDHTIPGFVSGSRPSVGCEMNAEEATRSDSFYSGLAKDAGFCAGDVCTNDDIYKWSTSLELDVNYKQVHNRWWRDNKHEWASHQIDGKKVEVKIGGKRIKVMHSDTLKWQKNRDFLKDDNGIYYKARRVPARSCLHARRHIRMQMQSHTHIRTQERARCMCTHLYGNTVKRTMQIAVHT